MYKLNKLFNVVLILLTIILARVSAYAEESVVKIKDKKATLNFEDELVEGASEKPELFYIFQKKSFNYGKLIKLRENFIPEMRNTTESIQRVRREH